MQNTLTLEKLNEMANLLKGHKTPKDLFFEKFFPDIDNTEDYSLFIPLKHKEELLKTFSEINVQEDDFKEWIFFDDYMDTIMAVNLKGIK